MNDTEYPGASGEDAHARDPLLEALVSTREHVCAVAAAHDRDKTKPYRNALLNARAATTRGDWMDARQTLRRAAAAHPAELDADPLGFMATACYCLQFDLAQDAAGRFFPGLGSTMFRLSRDDDAFCMNRPGVARWEISGRGRSTISLGPSFWAAGHDLCLSRLSACLPVIARFLRTSPRETGFAYFNMADHAFAPGFASSAPRGEFFLVPDPDYLLSAGHAQIGAYFAAHQTDYRSRRRVAFWRGGTQGFSNSGWRGVPRIKMCLTAKESQHAHLLDFRITTIVNSYSLPETDNQAVRNSGIMGDFVPPSALVDYQCHVDIDGHSNAWAALFMKLLSGSPVVKVASEAGFRQWYYDRLEPWINYVPAAPDLSDLVEKIVWLQEHEDAAELIGRRGRELALGLDYESEVRRMTGTIDEAMDALAAGRTRPG